MAARRYRQAFIDARVPLGATHQAASINAFTALFLGMAIFLAVAACALSLGEYAVLRRAVLNGEYQVVEGYIGRFVPMPYTGHPSEHFAVGGVEFEYSDYLITSAFNQTRSHGSPLDEGVYVRIWYRKGKILRIWVEADRLRRKQRGGLNSAGPPNGTAQTASPVYA